MGYLWITSLHFAHAVISANKAERITCLGSLQCHCALLFSMVFLLIDFYTILNCYYCLWKKQEYWKFVTSTLPSEASENLIYPNFFLSQKINQIVYYSSLVHKQFFQTYNKVAIEIDREEQTSTKISVEGKNWYSQ